VNYYKVLDIDGSPRNGGKGVWHLPKGKRPGKWMPPIVDLKPCIRGYHVCRLKDLFHWLGPRIFLVEIRGNKIRCDDKIVAEQARLVQETSWTDRTARLFAADCAEHVLHLWAQKFPKDSRPQHAIEMARRFTRGECTDVELSAAGAAAGDAAWAAARAAAGAARAAWDAAGAARAARAAWDAAGAAAGAAGAARAAWDAARDAAFDAAREAERKWQTRRLLRYLTPEA